MTPKEKADELVLNFFRIQDDVINHETTWHEAKQCALILCDEIIKNGFNPHLSYDYWKQVKIEIQNL